MDKPTFVSLVMGVIILGFVASQLWAFGIFDVLLGKKKDYNVGEDENLKLLDTDQTEEE